MRPMHRQSGLADSSRTRDRKNRSVFSAGVELTQQLGAAGETEDVRG